MKIKVIGCGTAFSTRLFNQSFLIEESTETFGTRRMLIDFGRNIPEALAVAEIPLDTIDDVYISHVHSDHIGGLETFGFYRYDWIKKPRMWGFKTPRLITHEQLMFDLWHNSLKGGMESSGPFEAFFETFTSLSGMFWMGWNVDFIKQAHIIDEKVQMPSYGLYFHQPGRKSIYIVTDSRHYSPGRQYEIYEKADYIIQDCELTGVDTSQNKMSKFYSGVHANYAQLAGYPSAKSPVLPDNIKSKMLLSHYQDFKLDNIDGFKNPVNWDQLAIADGFAGFVKLGETIEI